MRQHKAISIFLFLFIFLSIFAVTGHPKETVIDKNAYKELKSLHSVIKVDNETIVIARHGLEWWTAWALYTKVGQDKAIDSELFNKYRRIIFINQISGFSDDSKKTPFHEPKIPRNSEMIFSAEYFKAFKLNNNQ
jgi:energy-coupling factor transporter ATP-binding protein EcfA2